LSLHRAAYRFLDAPFVLETDSPAFLTQFDRAYGDFRDDGIQVTGTLESAGHFYQVILSNEPAVTVDEETWHSADPEALELFACNAILNAATGRVCSHFLFHAAALATPDGRGVILAGGSGLGKTTLTLALLARGFRFFSDDVAAVGRADGCLYPFPRRLGVRPAGGRPGEKTLLDAATLAPGSLLDCPICPAHFLFFLTDPAAATGPACGWYLLLDRLDDALLADLATAPGVRRLGVARGEPYPALHLDLAPAALPAAEPAIAGLCRHHGVLLFEITGGPAAPPDFSAAPRLEPLSPADAGRELLGHLKGGSRSALLEHVFGGSAVRLYLALAGLAAQMARYRLCVGQLEETVELILATTRG
jgi:hypothetical protein